MKHAHLIGKKVRIVRLPETFGYLKNTDGELTDVSQGGCLTGPGLPPAYAVLRFGAEVGGKRGIHMNISLKNEDEYSLEAVE